MSPSFYDFVKGHEPVSPEEIAAKFLSLTEPNGDARVHVERIIENDPRFLWEGRY